MPKILDRIRGKEADDSSDEALLGQLAGYPHLLALKPKERLVFRSDYVQIDDDYVLTVLDFFHSDESGETFPMFWGADLIPTDLEDNDVTTMLFRQTRRMTDEWINRHQNQSDKLRRMSARDQTQNGSTKGKQKISKELVEQAEVFQELADGGAYVENHFSLVVKAPNIETLDWAIDSIGRQYAGRKMSTIKLGVYDGEQRQSMAKLFSFNKRKRNKGGFFTSQEFAGSYGLITNGFDDPEGEYIGRMLYDYNKSAIVFDVDDYMERVVVAHPKRLRELNSSFSDAWASKLSQAALVNNHRVVHLILSESTDLDRLGPAFDDITRRIDMRNGDINMFEVFGDVKDEIPLFSQNIVKIGLMVDQLFDADKSDRSIALNTLSDVLEEFYVENGMWTKNAAMNREDIRVVGIPHQKVPLLHLFADYVESRYQTSIAQGDANMTKIYKLLQSTIKSMLDINGDLFDQHTTSTIDEVSGARRVVYDFSGLLSRGPGVAMAQLVNIVSFAVSSLEEGDLVVIHGADNIVNAHDFTANDLMSNEVKHYIDRELTRLMRRGGRVAFVYEKIETMLADREFSHFDSADYTVLGTMSANTTSAYETALGKNIPAPLKQSISNEASNACFIRRGTENVVFEMNLALGFTTDRTKMAQPKEMNQPITPMGSSPGMSGGSSSKSSQPWSTGAAKRAGQRQEKVLRRKPPQRRTLGHSNQKGTEGPIRTSTARSNTTRSKDEG